jgi:uncharacterized membrane protein YhhN
MIKDKLSRISFIFWFLAAIHILFIVFGIDIWRAISKVLIMPALFFYFWQASPYLPVRLRFHVAFVLFFSWLGDVFLLWPGGFVLGLGGFLIAQLGYAALFFKLKSPHADAKAFFARRIFWSLAIAFYGFAFLRILYPVLVTTDFFFPVLAYTLAISLMGISTALRNGATTHSSYLTGLAGAILFIGSDSLIAINTFLDPFSGGAFAIMVTYILAQWLLIQSILRHHRLP